MITSENDFSENTFHDLDMTGERVKFATFLDCIFERCSLIEAVFQSCRFVGCVFKECDCTLMQAPNSTFAGSRFENTKLIGVNWSQSDWPDHGIGEPLIFKKCSLNHSTFLGVTLGAVKMRGCEAVNVDFREADISGADFSFTDLKESLFQSTDLRGVDFRHARNYHIDPSQNKIAQARFSLPEAMALLYSMDIELTEP